MINLPPTVRSTLIKISQLTALTHVASKTIRYYETIELLPQPARNENGYREYDLLDVERLIFIRRCRELQIPLEQIKVIMQVKADKTSSCKEVDELIALQLKKVRNTISELTLLEQSLHTLVNSCQKDIVGECQILKSLQRKD